MREFDTKAMREDRAAYDTPKQAAPDTDLRTAAGALLIGLERIANQVSELDDRLFQPSPKPASPPPNLGINPNINSIETSVLRALNAIEVLVAIMDRMLTRL